MKHKLVAFFDIFLVPSCFLFLISTCVKIVSYTFLWNLISSDQCWAAGALVLFVCISFIFTHPLCREIRALRLPLEDWLRFHRLR